MKKTHMVKTQDIKRSWHLVDCQGATLGRLATKIAKLLTGKGKRDYTANQDMGDYVVVINAKDIVLTGNKKLDKIYYRHSMYPGGFREEAAGKLLARDSRKVVEHALLGMLPKNKLRDARMTRLKIYAGAEHPHQAQFEVKE